MNITYPGTTLYCYICGTYHLQHAQEICNNPSPWRYGYFPFPFVIPDLTIIDIPTTTSNKTQEPIMKRKIDKAARRERIATAALTGLLANSKMDGSNEDFAHYSVRLADALIAELDEEDKP